MADASPRRTALDTIILQAKRDRKRLDSSAVGTFSLTAIGIASVVGGGIFVTTGVAAAQHAGPAVVLSFVFAGIAALITALCYAELASMIPAAGSTYSYVYAAFGVFPAWFIGWDLLLEYMFAASAVAVGWSGYAVSFLGDAGIHIPDSLANPPFGSDAGIVNLPAIFSLASTVLVSLYGQTRIFMRMASYGMLPPAFGKVSQRFKTPEMSTI